MLIASGFDGLLLTRVERPPNNTVSPVRTPLRTAKAVERLPHALASAFSALVLADVSRRLTPGAAAAARLHYFDHNGRGRHRYDLPAGNGHRNRRGGSGPATVELGRLVGRDWKVFSSGEKREGERTVQLRVCWQNPLHPDRVPYTRPLNPAVTEKEFVIEQRDGPLMAALYGDYVFSVHSYTGNGTALGGEGVSVGVLRFGFARDGSPSITGELDYNGALGSFQALPVTGTYSVDGNGVSRIMIQSSAGTQHFDLSIQVSQLIYTGHITQGALVETDAPLLAGSGMLYARGVFNPPDQSAPPLKVGLQGTLLQLDGQTYLGAPFPLPVSLTESSGGGVLPTTVDLVSGAYVQRGVPAVLNDNAKPDAFGRFPFTLSLPGEPAQVPTNYAAYSIDDKRVLVLSTDPVAANELLLNGTATVPTPQYLP